MAIEWACSPTEQCVLELPAVLVARLAALSSEQCSTCGARWASKFRSEAEGIGNAHARERELASPESEWVSRLSELSRLAKVAAESRRGMFMWMCP
jgi:hypothetical protein